MISIVLFSLLGAAYLFGGVVNWLVSVLEMMGDTSRNSYLASINSFSKRNTFNEVAVVAYLVLCWPLHLALKNFFNE